MKWIKKVIHWREYKDAMAQIITLVRLAAEASEDGKVDEEEAKELGIRIVGVAYTIKDLL